MLPTDILDHLCSKQTIRDSAVVRIQVAFLDAINAFFKTQPDASFKPKLNRMDMQLLAQAPQITVGQPGGISDDEVKILAGYLLKAYLGYVDAYANFYDPSQAALATMKQFTLTI